MRTHWSDWTLIAVYLGAILLIGWWKGREESSLKDFVGGGQKVPWWAVLGSLVATEISALTFLNVPGVAFTGDLTYLQFGIGTIAGRFVVGYLFLTAFYQTRYLTVYSYLADRFGPGTRYAATGLFLLTRVLGASLRLSLAALGVSVIFDLPFILTLLLFGAMALGYTFWGGIKAVMWTDLVQALVFVGAGLATCLWLGHVMGGWSEILRVASDAEKTRVFNLSPSAGGWTAWLREGQWMPLAMLNGFLMIIASLGTDQDLTQRLLTCKKVGDARRSVILSGFVGIPIAAMFLFLGLGLFAFAHATPEWIVPVNALGTPDANRVFPSFIAEQAPVLLRGLLIVGVFAAAMSSVDSAMGALSSTLTVDLYKPLLRPKASEAHYVWVSRFGVLGFGTLLIVLAYLFQHTVAYLWLAFEIASIPAGALLGIFLLGLLTKNCGNDRGNLLGLAVALTVTSTLAVLRRTDHLNLDWTWLIIIGMCLSFGIGSRFSRQPVAPTASSV